MGAECHLCKPCIQTNSIKQDLMSKKKKNGSENTAFWDLFCACSVFKNNYTNELILLHPEHQLHFYVSVSIDLLHAVMLLFF